MLYFRVLFYIRSLLLLSYHYLQLIPDICRTGQVQGILSYDRSKDSSKTSCPHSAIQSFLVQMRVSSPFLKVIQQLPTSSSSSSCYFHPPFFLSFTNPLQKLVSMQNVTNPVSLPFTYLMQDIPLLPDSKQHFFISHMIGPADVQGISCQFVILLVYHLNNTKRENIFGALVSTN